MSDGKEVDTSWVGAAYRDQVSTQSYAPGARIEGVEVIDLRLHSDEGGDFCEVARFAPGGTVVGLPDCRIAQLSMSVMAPGAIKAWHLHHHQDDLWCVPPHDRILVGLLDVRAGSVTYQQQMRFVLGAGTARLLLIPRGVAHGAANLGTSPVTLVYLLNQQFDPQNPDEHRLPYDLLGPDFWSIQPG